MAIGGVARHHRWANVHGTHLAEPEEDHCCVTAAAQETPAPPEMAHGDDRLAGFSRELFRFPMLFSWEPAAISDRFSCGREPGPRPL